MPNELALDARGLTRSYGRLVALKSLDLKLRPGECVALIGANGSGKSTAVKAMTGLLEPSDGSVRIAGFDPHVEPEAESARAALALVPDSPLLYDDLTVRQHLELVTLAHGADDGGDRRAARAPRADRAGRLPARRAVARDAPEDRAGVRTDPPGAAAGARRAGGRP